MLSVDGRWTCLGVWLMCGVFRTLVCFGALSCYFLVLSFLVRSRMLYFVLVLVTRGFRSAIEHLSCGECPR